ncbi:hypothetical protein ACPPVU_11175 [Mucilaginibacter sp. McL0603]|uniref:hypothetical protein n=1 Tax=Mucilaginibacter sp. McL0603 TaxID=3415670 RepID=UPI003CEC0BF6
MKLISKILSVLSFSVVFILLAETSFAQYMTFQPILMGANWSANQRTTYNVTFKDSSVKEVFSLMYTDTILHKNYLLFVDKNFPKSDTVHRNHKIYPDQTIYISTNRDIQSDKEIYGVPNDSCWMFTVIGGQLTVYARNMNYLRPASKGYSYSDELYEPAITGIQINDGPVLPFNADNLKKMVGQNVKALELIADKKYFRAIKRYNKDAEKGTRN